MFLPNVLLSQSATHIKGAPAQTCAHRSLWASRAGRGHQVHVVGAGWLFLLHSHTESAPLLPLAPDFPAGQTLPAAGPAAADHCHGCLALALAFTHRISAITTVGIRVSSLTDSACRRTRCYNPLVSESGILSHLPGCTRTEHVKTCMEAHSASSLAAAAARWHLISCSQTLPAAGLHIVGTRLFFCSCFLR